ncbi:MAG TPA: TatD family hydrolase [Spirochaetota bacterium]|nr:TatD family hydrolase [Spirochaetota bacterium]HPN82015.1 TatD family hydrolase [Spirochaetota bacterium]
MYADAHAHLHDQRLRTTNRPGTVRSRAGAAGLDLVCAASVSPSDWMDLVRFLEAGTGEPCESGLVILPSFGLHPAFDTGEYDALRDGIPSNGPRPRAIGEIGLDQTVDTPMEWQCERLEMMLALASSRNLPVILHARGPWDRLFCVLDRYPGVHGIMHAFGGAPEIARECIRRGYLLSAGPRLLDSGAKKMRASFAEIPLPSIVLESDAPDMCPIDETPPNEPSVIVRVAETLAKIRGESAEKIAVETRRNLLRLFDTMA